MQDRSEEIAGAGWIRVSRGDQDKVWRVTWLPRHDRDDLLPAETFSPAHPDDLPDDWPDTNDPDDLMHWAVNRYEGQVESPDARFRLTGAALPSGSADRQLHRSVSAPQPPSSTSRSGT